MRVSRTYKHLYVVTRQDMSLGYQGVQSIHAAFEMMMRHPGLVYEWHTYSNYLCWLSVTDESALWRLVQRATRQGVDYAVFTEPDVQDALTAIALAPGKLSARLVQGLPLALSREGAQYEKSTRRKTRRSAH